MMITKFRRLIVSRQRTKGGYGWARRFRDAAARREWTRLTAAERRRLFIDEALATRAESERTGIAYSLKEVRRYLTARLAGKRVRRPRPLHFPVVARN
jgi:hypothetical protein